MLIKDYIPRAKENEELFRNVLKAKHLNEKNLSIDEICKTYSCQQPSSIAIIDFQVGPINNTNNKLADNELSISIERMHMLNGHGQKDVYKFNEDNLVQYIRQPSNWSV